VSSLEPIAGDIVPLFGGRHSETGAQASVDEALGPLLQLVVRTVDVVA
jgi:hypothetical protein